MARFLADIDLKFGIGFEADNEQEAKVKLDKVKESIKKDFKFQFGNDVKITSRIKKLPF